MTLPLSHDSIAANLTTRLVGREVVVYKSTASTNDLAWRYASDAGKDGLAIFAENQTAGRGRHGNKWSGGTSSSLLCSVLLLNTAIRPGLLSLAAGIAVARAIGRCGCDIARLKWPNDVILNGRKVAGILVESKVQAGRTAFVVGMGINCCQKQEDFDPELADQATSIELAAGCSCNRNDVARSLLIELDEWLIAAGNPQSVKEAWLERACQLNQRLTLQHNHRSYTGTCVGIDPIEGLILQLDGGGIRMFDAASTHTVRQA